MRNLKAALAVALLVGAVQSAEADNAEQSVFGVRLGEPLSLPECSFTKKYGRVSYDIPSFRDPPPDCWKRNYFGTPGVPLEGNETVVLQFQSLPFGFEADTPSAKLIDGRVEKFTFSTQGSAQEDVFQALVQKYGRPTSHKVEQLQNRMGASFASISAHWEFPNLSVMYLGLGSTVEKGILVIASSKANQEEQERMKKQKAAERQM